MNTSNTFARFKKIDAHTHIGAFGSPFNIHFDTERLLQQMEAYNIEKTILVASGPHTNEDTAAAFRAEPQKIIPLMWINCAEGKEAYDALEHYIRDEHFAGAKLQPLFDGYTADAPCVDPVAEICEAYGKPLFVHSGHPPFSLPWQIGLLAERHPKLPMVMIHMGHAHERVMFGIDSPFHHPTVEIQKVMACGVDDEGLENIFYNNAAKFMGLK